MARSASSHEGGSDGAAFLMTVAVFVVGIGLGGWYLWEEMHAEISAIAMQTLHGQMRLIHLFTDRYDVADAQVMATDPTKVKFLQLVRLAREVGRFFLLPSIGLVLVLAAACFSRAGAKRFSRALDLEGLMREQVKTFRAPAAFVRRRLGLVEIDHKEPRPADRALSRAEWIARWAADKNGGFNEGAAWAELARQLGDPRREPEDAPPHLRCMLAVFALHRAQRRDEALAYLGDLSESLVPAGKEGRGGPAKGLAFPVALIAKADDLLGSRDFRQPLVDTMSMHGFTTTATMSVLIAARQEGGILPPAQFGFLKLVDRRLWYALHSLGYPADMFNPQLHPTPRVEALGARDHWATERMLGEALSLPSIDRALSALREASSL